MDATVAPYKCIVSSYLERELRDVLLRLATAAVCSLSAEIRRALVAHRERVTHNQETTP